MSSELLRVLTTDRTSPKARYLMYQSALASNLLVAVGHESHRSQALEILRNVSQFIIPIYQRTYSWTRKECEQLWADILRAGSSDGIGVHFIGSVVHIDEGRGAFI